jgi:two-component system cell cycle response regulator
LKSISALVDAVRKRLKKDGVSHETSENLVSLLNALLTSFSSEKPREDELMARLADAFADSSSLLALIQQQAAELDALKRITFTLTSSLEPQEVLDGLVKEAMQLVKDANDAHIFLYQNEKMEFGASLMADGSRNESFADPRPNGMTQHIANTRQLLVVEDIQNHPLFQNAPPEWNGSIIGIPLMMGDRVIGVMNLARTRTGPFTQSEIRLLTLLADQASIAIINARLHQAVSEQARRDVLTGLPNRRALDERLDDEITRSARSGRVFCTIMMDLDGFKLVNDTYGHDVGDDVLRQISRSLQENLRASDFLARYGGDELTLVLSDTDLNQAQVVVKKIKKNLANLPIPLPDGGSMFMTISGGIALHPLHATNAPGLLRAADEALYKAKRNSGSSFVVAHTRDA